MTVSLDGKLIQLTGDCPVEDAEPLLGHLSAGADMVVDLRQSGHLHTAVVQLLLAHKPKILGPVGDRFLQTWLPVLAGDTCSIAN